MRQPFIAFIFCCLCVTSFIGANAWAQSKHEAQAQGGQYVQLGQWEVHYSAFASSFLLPEVAQAYKLTRSRAQGILSLSVLDPATKASQRVAVSGYALNELGQRRELTFRRISEGDAIYYLASVPHSKEESYRFFINLRLGDTVEELRFQHTFYRS